LNFPKLTLPAALLAGSLSGLASVVPDSTTFNVPFAFSVNGQELPAGTYRVTEFSETGVLYIQGKGLGAIVVTSPAPAMPRSETALVFAGNGALRSLIGLHTDFGSRTVPSHPGDHANSAMSR
jgi:hypothetical protein